MSILAAESPLPASRLLQLRRRVADSTSVVTLMLAVLVLLSTAPRHGEFWWSDAPRHALNGVFLADLVRDMPFDHLRSWAVDYYLQYPALTILFYPPLLAACEAVAYLLFGVSHAAALGTIGFFYLLLALGTYALARRLLPPIAAFAAALILSTAPEVAFWGRQIMTEIPAYALLVWSAFFFDRALVDRRAADLYATLILLLAAAYTKLTVLFVMPVFAIVLLVHSRGAALRNRHVVAAAAIAIVGMIPLALMTWQFGQGNIGSVTDIPDAPGRDSLASWLFYLQALPSQIGWLPLALAGSYLAALASGRHGVLARRARYTFALWFAVGYLFFSSILLKEHRHTVFLLLPIALAAAAAPGEWLKDARIAGGLTLAAALAVFVSTLALRPAPYVRGQDVAARWIVNNTPPGRVMYSGIRDGYFIFDVRALDTGRRYTVVRATKLFANFAVRRALGVQQSDLDAGGMLHRIQELGIEYVVAERNFWIDLKAMRTLQELLQGGHFEEVARIPVSSNYPDTVDEPDVRIYRLRDPVNRHPAPLSIDLPIINRHFEQERR